MLGAITYDSGGAGRPRRIERYGLPLLEVTLRHFMERIHRITFGQRGLTCSIGALPVRPDCAPEQLYLEADRLLYTAKEQGRNQYVIGN